MKSGQEQERPTRRPGCGQAGLAHAAPRPRAAARGSLQGRPVIPQMPPHLMHSCSSVPQLPRGRSRISCLPRRTGASPLPPKLSSGPQEDGEFGRGVLRFFVPLSSKTEWAQASHPTPSPRPFLGHGLPRQKPEWTWRSKPWTGLIRALPLWLHESQRQGKLGVKAARGPRGVQRQRALAREKVLTFGSCFSTPRNNHSANSLGRCST